MYEGDFINDLAIIGEGSTVKGLNILHTLAKYKTAKKKHKLCTVHDNEEQYRKQVVLEWIVGTIRLYEREWGWKDE